MKIAIVMNKKRLTPALEEKLKSDELTTKYNITYDLFLPEPAEIEKTLKNLNLQSYNAVLVGGGDGTVRTAAQQLIGQDIPLIILPLGTFNLLAKTLEYPNDIDAIFAIIKNGKTKKIDLVEVNNNIVINHAWIGFYYYILKLRDKHKNILGKNKLLKILFNTMNLFKLIPVYQLEIKVDDQIVNYKTCLVYIGNNDSYMNLLNFGERKSLTSGLLAVTILKCQTRWSLFLCMINILLGRLKETECIVQFSTDHMVIKAESNLINIVIDGELFKLEVPLTFTNHQKQLTVFTP